MNESFSGLEGEKFPDFSDVSKVIEERLAGVVVVVLLLLLFMCCWFSWMVSITKRDSNIVLSFSFNEPLTQLIDRIIIKASGMELDKRHALTCGLPVQCGRDKKADYRVVFYPMKTMKCYITKKEHVI
jgi:hypothetical protein